MRRRSIRFRITALAVVVVAVVVATAGIGTVVVQRRLLERALDETLTQRADAIEALVGSSAPPAVLPATPTEGFAQLVGLDGDVVASTPNLEGVAPLALEDRTAGDAVRTVDDLPVDDDAFRVLSRDIAGVGTLHVATTADVIDESVASLVAALAITAPVVVAAIGAVVWWLVGRTLRPVHAITAEAAAIGDTAEHRRVPVPDTGDEIAELASAMNAMLDRLDAHTRRQRQFVGDASHELRTPLTRLRSAIEVELGRAEGAQHALLSGLLDDTIDMQRLVDDMLALARVTETGTTLTVEPVDLDVLVLQEARRLRESGRVHVDTTGVSAAHVVGDTSQLSRAIRNLLDNAGEHADSLVDLTLTEDGARAILTIGDDGNGLPPGAEEAIFHRFMKLDDARTAGTGSGLGLAITREIIERHGGEVTAATRPGGGAEFVVTLPSAD
jgi:signal transduction histidine kinase